MRKILVFQHVPYELLGTLHPLLKKAGFRIKYLNFWRHPDLTADISKYDGLIILGGPMGVYEADEKPHLRFEIECIKKAISQDKPVLGICLGSQLIAAALGARVAPASQPEIGWYNIRLTEEGRSDPVLGGALTEEELLFQWHSDRFELPNGAVWLATSELCEYQAFRYGDKIYGLQFHLEVDDMMIRGWLERPENRVQLAELGGEAVVAKIRSETAKHIERSYKLSQLVFLRYLDLCSARHKLRHISKRLQGNIE